MEDLGKHEERSSVVDAVYCYKELHELSYVLKIYALEDGKVRCMWEEIGGQISILSPDRYGHIDWSIFEGIIVNSLEAKDAISRPRAAAPSESSSPLAAYDGFGSLDCDGIHVSSCGHVVHQACLDRYLSSLKERGECLCPVCRGLANSSLPALPRDSQKVSRPPMVSTVSWPDAGQLSSANRETDFHRFREALSLLRSATDVAGRSEILKAFPMHRNGRIRPNPESMFRVLSGMYFPGKQDRISGSARVSHSVIMWDTLKYSLISGSAGGLLVCCCCCCRCAAAEFCWAAAAVKRAATRCWSAANLGYC
ncbi:unnamed protein product [Camellia sinensis]